MDYTSWENFLELEKDKFKTFKVFKFKEFGNDWTFRFQSGLTDKKRENGWMNFQFIDGYLIITGDYGCGIFSWDNRSLTLNYIANINDINYFIEKCKCNDNGQSNARMYIWLYAIKEANKLIQIKKNDILTGGGWN